MEQQLQVFVFPLDLPSPYANSVKPSSENDPTAEADVLVTAAARTMDSTASPAARDIYSQQQHQSEQAFVSRATQVETQRAATAVPNTLMTPKDGMTASMSSVTSAALNSRTDLARRLHYAAASYLCELERGHVLSRSTPHELLRSAACSALATVTAADVAGKENVRHHYVYPLEEGRYAASLSIPSVAHAIFGSQLIPTIISTAVRGYDVASRVAASSAVPTYFPLHLRLREDATAVQRALQSRVAQIGAVSQLCQRSPTIQPSHWTADKEETLLLSSLRRMCHQDRPCPLRISGQLSRTLHELIRVATQANHPSSLTGSLVSVGAQSAIKRFHLIGAAAWYNGEPVYISAAGPSCESYLEKQLTAAAVAVTLDAVLLQRQRQQETQHDQAGEHGKVRVQFKCIAMHAPAGGAAPFAGYVAPTVRPEEREHGVPAALALACTNGGKHGWTVTLLLKATPIPFAGTPLPYILSGIQQVLTRHLLTGSLASLLPSDSLGRALGVETSTGFHPFLKTVNIAVRPTTLGRHAAALSAKVDVCLWYYQHGMNETEETDGKGKKAFQLRMIPKTICHEKGKSRANNVLTCEADKLSPAEEVSNNVKGNRTGVQSGEVSDQALETLLLLASRMQSANGRRQRRARRQAVTTRLLSLSHTVFSVIAQETRFTVLHAVPSNGSVAYVTLELESSAPWRHKDMIALQKEVLRFTTWALSKCSVSQ